MDDREELRFQLAIAALLLIGVLLAVRWVGASGLVADGRLQPDAISYRSFALSGIITDEQGNPLRDVRVEIVGLRHINMTSTTVQSKQKLLANE